jgi:hypothetical protein
MHQLFQCAAVHQLIGDVESQQAVQTGPHGVRDIAGIARQNVLIDASLNEDILATVPSAPASRARTNASNRSKHSTRTFASRSSLFSKYR